MEGDLFSAGFAWGADPVADDATPTATSEMAFSSPEMVSNGHRNGGAVATVATVAETEGRRLERVLSPQIVAAPATPLATASATGRTADFCGVRYNSKGPVAGVASVADWRDGVESMRRVRPAPKPYHTPWKILFQDAVSFLNLWGDDAFRLGWDTLDVFGGNPDPSHGRYDRLGLVILLAGRPVQALDESCAYIGKDGHPTVYHRALRAAGGVPVWQWVKEGWQ